MYDLLAYSFEAGNDVLKQLPDFLLEKKDFFTKRLEMHQNSIKSQKNVSESKNSYITPRNPKKQQNQSNTISVLSPKNCNDSNRLKMELKRYIANKPIFSNSNDNRHVINTIKDLQYKRTLDHLNNSPIMTPNKNKTIAEQYQIQGALIKNNDSKKKEIEILKLQIETLNLENDSLKNNMKILKRNNTSTRSLNNKNNLPKDL